MDVTREELVGDLKDIGIVEGDTLALGVSLRKVGWIEGGPETFLEAVLESVGPGGTIFMPTYTRNFPLHRLRGGSAWGRARSARSYVFNPETTLPVTGKVPVTLLGWPGVKRSSHPTNSIGAVGKHAGYLVEGHDEHSPGYTPYLKLAQLGGHLLCVGLDGKLVGFRHEAQYLAGLLTILPPIYGVRYIRRDGTTGLYEKWDLGGCTTRLPELNAGFIERGLISPGRLGKAETLLVQADPVLYQMASMLRSDPTLNLCRDYSCYWCREIERKLDLYPHIEDPCVFQRNGLLAKTTRLINAARTRAGTMVPASILSRVMANIMNPPGSDAETV